MKNGSDNEDIYCISIIIPAYNMERLVTRSVMSALNQTYSNIEVILVDDGSTDKTGEIVDVISLKDKRLKVFHQSNQGIAAALNSGIDKSDRRIYFIPRQR